MTAPAPAPAPAPTSRRADEPPRATVRALAGTAATAAGAGLTGLLLGGALAAVAGHRQAAWVLGRSAGIASYLLLVALVATGLVLAHPRAARLQRPSPAARIRLHLGLAAATGTFAVLHVVVLATDRWAGVGWAGALLPLGASYRPVPVTLGLLGAWSGLAAGLTAALAGRGAGRVWRPVHHVAVAAFVLVWAHGVLAGSDTRALLPLYLATGAGLVLLGLSRHAVRDPVRDPARDSDPGRDSDAAPDPAARTGTTARTGTDAAPPRRHRETRP